MTGPFRGRVPLLALAGFGLVACTTRVDSVVTSPPPAMPTRPDVIVVHDFESDAAVVKLDPGRDSRLRRGSEGITPGKTQAEDAATVRNALTVTLVRELAGTGVPALTSLPPSPQRTVVSLQGRVLNIDEGNRRRRTVVGLGSGMSVVSVRMSIVYQAPGGEPRVLQEFTVSSDSGHMPGAAETMGVGAAAGTLATSAAITGGTHLAGETHHTGVEGEADHVAAMLADNVRKLFVQNGWTPAPAK